MSKKGITRKTFLQSTIAGIGSVIAAPFIHTSKASASSSGDGRPNILFICMDQLRSWTTIPEDLPLPAHQKLLAEGIGFKNYQVNQSPCGPSRAVIYTGQHNQRNGVYNNAPTKRMPKHQHTQTVELEPGYPTIGSMFRDAGYYTAYKGKWHLSNIAQTLPNSQFIYPNAENSLEPYGFSDYSFTGENIGLTWAGHRSDGAIAAEAITQMRAFQQGKTEGKPWFMAVNLINPHDIMFYDATGKQRQTRKIPNLIGPLYGSPGDPLYDKDWGYPLPASFDDDLTRKPAQHQRDLDSTIDLFGAIPKDDEASWLRLQNYYFNCIRDVDRRIMSMLNELESSGQMDNTIVVMTADHGDMVGAHGMRGKYACLYKENLNVPLIIRHPDVKGGQQAAALGSAVDLAPTLLSMAGLSASERDTINPELPGVDLSPVLANPTATTERNERGALVNFVSFSDLKPNNSGEQARPDLPRALMRGIYTGRYKYGRYFSPVEHHTPEDWQTLIKHNDIELYDVIEDPDEMNNLAYKPETHKELILKLNAQLNELIEKEVGEDLGAMYPGKPEDYILNG